MDSSRYSLGSCVAEGSCHSPIASTTRNARCGVTHKDVLLRFICDPVNCKLARSDVLQAVATTARRHSTGVQASCSVQRPSGYLRTNSAGQSCLSWKLTYVRQRLIGSSCVFCIFARRDLQQVIHTVKAIAASVPGQAVMQSTLALDHRIIWPARARKQ